MAYKNYTQSVWSEWLDRCRQAHSGALTDHPEGLWAHVWNLFQNARASAEEERAYLFARRKRDEFWYVQRFGLHWPQIHKSAGSAAETFVTFADPSGSPPPSPEPRRLILLFGYWPPTDIGIGARHGMLWPWKDLQENWEGRGYDVLAISPTFAARVGWHDAAMTIPFWGRGTGQLQVDYLKTSEDFWDITLAKNPIAIMSFSRGDDDVKWTFEEDAGNYKRVDWFTKIDYFDNAGAPKEFHWIRPHAGGSADDFSPYKSDGTIAGFPPDRSEPADTRRASTLPIDDMMLAIGMAIPAAKLLPAKNAGNAGHFISEYMAYHVAWYRSYINGEFPAPSAKRCEFAGHTHVGIKVARDDAEDAVEIQLRQLIEKLDGLMP